MPIPLSRPLLQRLSQRPPSTRFLLPSSLSSSSSPRQLLRTPQTPTPTQTQLASRTTTTRTTRPIHTTPPRADRSFTNLLADATPPPVQVASVGAEGVRLVDGLRLSGAAVFLEGKVFLWDVPALGGGGKGDAKGMALWDGWTEDHLMLFDVVLPTPEIVLLGTGERIVPPPPFVRRFLNERGIQLDVLDTRNACATYNLLAEEGRRVAAALLPIVSPAHHDQTKGWKQQR